MARLGTHLGRPRERPPQVAPEGRHEPPAYLLIGLLFALLYTVIARADPTLFVPVQDLDERNGLFYFSFVTLTTIGYGDITPAADWVRSIAVLEGLTGQIFLVVLVARLVGMEIAQRANESLQDPAARPEQ